MKESYKDKFKRLTREGLVNVPAWCRALAWVVVGIFILGLVK